MNQCACRVCGDGGMTPSNQELVLRFAGVGDFPCFVMTLDGRDPFQKECVVENVSKKCSCAKPSTKLEMSVVPRKPSAGLFKVASEQIADEP
jgi:hypothetical protein